MLGLVLLCLTLPTATPSEATWNAAFQLGGGQINHAMAGLVRPQLSGNWPHFAFTLSVPLWVSVEHPDTLFTSVDDADYYAAWLQKLDADIPAWNVSLHAGALLQETLAFGAVVDHFNNSLDPVHPRTGARLDFDKRGVAITALVDSVVAPHLWAAMVETHPLPLLALNFQAAADFSSALDGRGHLPVVLAATSSWAIAQPTWAVLPYLTVGMQDYYGLGTHLGLQVQWREYAEVPTRRPQRFATLQVEGLAASRGYTPGYFDTFYASESVSIASRARLPKSLRDPPPSLGVRSNLDIRWFSFRTGLALTLMGTAFSNANIYAQFMGPWAGLTLVVAQRWLDNARQLGQWTDATYVNAELTVPLFDNLFAFAQANHGWQFDGRPNRMWLAGMGYSGASAD